jgi:hypothetical protein
VKQLGVAYVGIIAAVALWISAQSRSETVVQVQKERQMEWSNLKNDVVVEAKPKGVWTWAVDYVKGPALIRIEAKGTWSYSKGRSCEADGDLNALISAQHAILPTAPIGALIVKFGGSTAGVNDGVIRIGGSKAIIQIDEQVSGPILLTINDDVTGIVDNGGTLTATVSMALLPATSPASAKKLEPKKPES